MLLKRSSRNMRGRRRRRSIEAPPPGNMKNRNSSHGMVATQSIHQSAKYSPTRAW